MRKSGVLMHITSLPGPYGVGTMGKAAFELIDFLHAAGQRFWQILPLSPTGYGDSPYQSCSAYAGNPYLIDLELLMDAGLLKKSEVTTQFWGDRDDKVDYGALYNSRFQVLRMAYGRFVQWEKLDAFCQKNSSWLPDYTLFMALKAKNQGLPWYQWKKSLKLRQPDAIWAVRQELKDEIRFQSFVQYLFYSQWEALRAYAHEKGVQIIGDVPIYVPYDSADVWSNPEYFQLDEDMHPTAVAGVPPDAFTEDGQLWGNPLYRWDVMKKDGYVWWLNRLRAAGQLYDVVRMDHFRGLEAYWAVPYGDKTARNGKWVKGPDMDFIRAVKENLPELEMIAEDLGFLTQEVLDLRDASGFPGMKVLGFAFDSREPSDYLPHSYPANSICYTGTHDNMTTQQWFDTADADAVAYAREYMHLTAEEGDVWGMIRTALASVSETCIIPMQDLLCLGSEARMNAPGTQDSANWTWRASSDCMDKDLAKRLKTLTVLYGRNGS